MKDGNLFTEANVLLNLRGNAQSLQKVNNQPNPNPLTTQP